MKTLEALLHICIYMKNSTLYLDDANLILVCRLMRLDALLYSNTQMFYMHNFSVRHIVTGAVYRSNVEVGWRSVHHGD